MLVTNRDTVVVVVSPTGSGTDVLLVVSTGAVTVVATGSDDVHDATTKAIAAATTKNRLTTSPRLLPDRTKTSSEVDLTTYCRRVRSLTKRRPSEGSHSHAAAP